jgi:hypothetical protein
MVPVDRLDAYRHQLLWRAAVVLEDLTGGLPGWRT